MQLMTVDNKGSQFSVGLLVIESRQSIATIVFIRGLDDEVQS